MLLRVLGIMLLMEVWQMLGMKIFSFVVHSLTSSLHTCLHPLFRSDKGPEEKQLSVSAIHDEGHDLILYEWHSQSIGQSHFLIYKILPGTMTEPSLCFQKCDRLRTHILYDYLPRFRADYYILIYTHCHELMKAVGSHGSCCCYLWWRWWSDTLWGTLIKLRLH
jgi:hypothetical protein